jgi:hypothetical protein
MFHHDRKLGSELEDQAMTDTPSHPKPAHHGPGALQSPSSGSTDFIRQAAARRIIR